MSSRRFAVVIALAVASVVPGSNPARAEIVSSGNAFELAGAMMADPAILAGAAFVSVPPRGTPNGIADTQLGEFPVESDTYAILTTGDVTVADQPNVSGDSGADIGGGHVRGTGEYDVSVLRIDLHVAEQNCLGFDFSFQSEEFPENVGNVYNDAFVAELNVSDWTTTDARVSAPNNFAFDTNLNPITVSSPQGVGVGYEHALGTYDGGTELLRATTRLPAGDANGALPGTDSVYLSIFDMGDHRFDSAVFIDNLTLWTVPAGMPCTQGARPAPRIEYLGDDSAYWGKTANLSVRLTDAITLRKLRGKSVTFILGSQSASAVTNGDGIAAVTLAGRTPQDVLRVRFFGDALYPRASAYPPFNVLYHPTSVDPSPVVARALPDAQPTFPFLSAVLTDGLDQRGIAGRQIEFRATLTDDVLCTAVSDQAGVAVCSSITPAVYALGSLGYSATFPGDDSYEAGEGHAGLVRVGGEDIPSI